MLRGDGKDKEETVLSIGNISDEVMLNTLGFESRNCEQGVQEELHLKTEHLSKKTSSFFSDLLVEQGVVALAIHLSC